MAKGKGGGTARVIQLRPQKAPNVTVRMPRASGEKKPKHRRRSGGGKSGKFDFVTPAVAGYILGYIDKNPGSIPTIPVLGRAGTLAAGAYFMRGNLPTGMGMKLAEIFAAIAFYEKSYAGQVQGRGVAARM